VVGGAVRELAAVGRETRKRFLAGRRAQPRRGAARFRDQPDIPCEDEGDLVGGHRRLTEHARIDLGQRRSGGRRERGAEHERSDHESILPSGTMPRVRRRFVWMLALAAGAVGCGRETTPAAARSFPRAPIVLISIDTLRADHLAAYGYRGGSTPALDRLAASGIVFDDAFSQVPLTLPSHASLLTGRLPTRTGVRDNIGFTLGADQQTLAARLKEAGYATGAAVSSYVLRRHTGIAAGFDFFDDEVTISGTGESLSESQRDGARTADALAAWIDAHAGGPMFAFLHLYEPHTPYTPPPSHTLAQPYDGEIAYADEIVGRFLDRLNANGLLDRAIVAVVSDHGEGLGDHGEAEHGLLLYREALRVPWIVRLPGSAHAGTRIAGAAGLVDVAPTLLALAGVPAAGMDGGPLVDAMVSRRLADRTVYSETQYPRLHYGWSDLASAFDGRYHFIRAPRPELYDLASDPGARSNLAAARARLRDIVAAAAAGRQPAARSQGQDCDLRRGAPRAAARRGGTRRRGDRGAAAGGGARAGHARRLGAGGEEPDQAWPDERRDRRLRQGAGDRSAQARDAPRPGARLRARARWRAGAPACGAGGKARSCRRLRGSRRADDGRRQAGRGGGAGAAQRRGRPVTLHEPVPHRRGAAARGELRRSHPRVHARDRCEAARAAGGGAQPARRACRLPRAQRPRGRRRARVQGGDCRVPVVARGARRAGDAAALAERRRGGAHG